MKNLIFILVPFLFLLSSCSTTTTVVEVDESAPNLPQHKVDSLTKSLAETDSNYVNRAAIGARPSQKKGGGRKNGGGGKVIQEDGLIQQGLGNLQRKVGNR